jgi:hypothetical protein
MTAYAQTATSLQSIERGVFTGIRIAVGTSSNIAGFVTTLVGAG